MLLIFLTGCTATDKDAKVESYIDNLLSRMTLREKIGQMTLPTGGDLVSGSVKNSELSESIRKGEVGGILNVKGVEKISELQRIAVEESRLGIPLIVGADVVHGYETIFPIPLAMSCSWDTTLIERAARISAIEASADGVSWTYSPMVDICRDARWGRIAEGAGEDPYLGSLIATAYVRGYQGDNMKEEDEIMSCVKHFALYGASESGRDYNVVDMSRNRMYNGYFSPYKAAVEAGAGSVMSSFNTVDGIPATANKWLLTDVLRNEWGFDGLIVTDYNSIGEMQAHGYAADLKEASARALMAGTDMDMVSCGYIKTLEESVKDGRVDESLIDKACRKVLEAKYKLGLFDNPYKYCDDIRAKTELFTPEHRQAAREIAARTFVLMKNNNILPLKGNEKIALVGPLADARNNMCGTWSMGCKTDGHISVYDGLKRALGTDVSIRYAKGSNLYYDEDTEKGATGGHPLEREDDALMLKEALNIASSSDIIIAAVGECAEMSGESASRSDIRIPDAQRSLLKALFGTGKPVIILLFTGRPLDLSWESEHAAAILNVWFGGSESGDAIADVLYGKVNPSGRLTTSFPRSIGQVPIYYNHMNTGRPDGDDARFNRYESNYIDESNTPLYPFGYGLSYTEFKYGDASLSRDTISSNEKIEVSVPVTNNGNYDGIETVQLYIRDLYADVCRPVKELRSYKQVFIPRGKTENVRFTLSVEDLKYYDSKGKYTVESGDFDLMVGPNSSNVQRKHFYLSK
ncbi:beta-glucosidase BglX [uncultured Bacteroides sp.]|uniref:beta-glucosidase BglX n=1 Tax=uncultured Bacteroides sp. TaxID=162156 RepID=UPI0026283013|nr:beta-glucosidase BglX [uncultured Bacteroides sp.]